SANTTLATTGAAGRAASPERATSLERATPPERATSVGETITEARRLEGLAPVGQILTSGVVKRQTHGRFFFSPLPATSSEVDGTYLVKAEMPMMTAYVPGKVAGRVTPLVGRAELLDKLQLALQAVIDSQTPHLVTLVGRPGAGKSRLVYEFEKQAGLLSHSPTILRAGTQGVFPDFPYALIRDFLLRRFSIRPQYSSYLIRHCLESGLAEIINRVQESLPLPAWGAEVVSLLERLLDPQAAAAISMDEVQAVFARLLNFMSAHGPVIIVLEGINRADRESLDLVERLVDGGQAGSVLFLGLATATEEVDPQQVLPWLQRGDDLFGSMERLDVPTLSAMDSRLMVAEILGLMTPLPMRLMDLVVAESDGNPLYIEAMVRLLIAREAIILGERRQVDMDQVENAPLPAGLPRLIEAQLANLPQSERKVLQYAAIFGPLCWDTALIELLPDQEMGAAGVEAALLSLEMQDYLAADDAHSFSAAQAYTFRRDSVRDAAYASIPPQERRKLHLNAANWLIANREHARLGVWYSIDDMIARHFAAAGEDAPIARWRRQAEDSPKAF
ncbi:MAG TPA: AAA family ATPase, partial [Promineifilum sp.]|nr:AAA family ATPase [Promineifilum sp.]